MPFVSVVPRFRGGSMRIKPAAFLAATAAVATSVVAFGAPIAAADPVPPGGGHGLCFDVNSQVARDAVASLPPNRGGYPWVIESGSQVPISQGCDGLLSWMTVDWAGTHPGSHVLFFTDGQYLGTATSKYYSYTDVLGGDRTHVQVRYRWALPQDALCCPSGGPSVVTFTLNGHDVTADGQFPPDPDQ
ncbi:LppP/LprE family lipoprotein [Nocardia terpenica]|uniref:LppP/LprE family lipoprotein n=2 Tax=Nocardia terpenica TaxID=455432 RepID=A0A6G9ZCF1_9NOCA|nr:LppP/LprE family lipoprotein [Nocardia terpenica]